MSVNIGWVLLGKVPVEVFNGGARNARPLSVKFRSFSCSFRLEFWQMISWRTSLWGWHPPGKSCVRQLVLQICHILVLPRSKLQESPVSHYKWHLQLKFLQYLVNFPEACSLRLAYPASCIKQWLNPPIDSCIMILKQDVFSRWFQSPGIKPTKYPF